MLEQDGWKMITLTNELGTWIFDANTICYFGMYGFWILGISPIIFSYMSRIASNCHTIHMLARSL